MYSIRRHTLGAGFTLIELLVVVVVIGVLMSLLFPVFAKVRERARVVACISNARQIGIALQEYAADNDERFMPRHDNDAGDTASDGIDPNPANFRNWCDWLQPYIASNDVERCPSYTGQYPIPNTTGPHGNITRYTRSTYLINDNIVSNPRVVNSSLANIPNPSSTMLVAESPSGNTAFADAGTGEYSVDPGPTAVDFLMCPESSQYGSAGEMHRVQEIPGRVNPWCSGPAISARVTCVAVDGSARSVQMNDTNEGGVTRDALGLLHDPPGGYGGLYVTGPDGELTIPGT